MKFKILPLFVIPLAVAFLVGFNSTPVTEANEHYDLIKEYKNLEKSANGVENYKKKIKEKITQLEKHKVNDISVTITFAKPLTYDELQRYIQKHNITAEQIQARGLNGEKRLTLATKPIDDMQNVVEKMLQPGNFVGYIDMYGVVNSSSLKALENDPLTFLVDPSGDSFFTDHEVYPHALSWLLEDIKNGH